MSKQPTMANERDRFGMTPADWERLQSMSDDEAYAGALADPDTQPIPQDRLDAAAHRPRSLAKMIRHKLSMGPDEFASAFGIPLATLLAWERGHSVPSPAEAAYLQVIERAPEIAKRTAATAPAAR